MKASEARALIGRKIMWDNRRSDCQSLFGPHYGIVEEVSGKNICISGDWRWLPDIVICATIEDEFDKDHLFNMWSLSASPDEKRRVFFTLLGEKIESRLEEATEEVANSKR